MKYFVLLFWLCVLSYSKEIESLKVSSYIDYGRIFKEKAESDSEVGTENVPEEVGDKALSIHRLAFEIGLEHLFANHQKGTVKVGGQLWRPQLYAPTQFYKTSMNFRPEIKEFHLSKIYKESSMIHKWSMGIFPVKLNENANNFGEYLYRTQAYPTILKTSQDWNLLGEASYKTLGMHSQFKTFYSNWTHDVNLFLEQEKYPFHSIMPSYVTRYQTKDFTVSGGVAWHHAYILNKPIFTENEKILLDSLELNDSPSAVHLMFLLSYDFQNITGFHSKLYSEVGVLGVKNRPVYYTKIQERMPVMMGIEFSEKNKWSIGMEWEYLKNPYLNRDNIPGKVYTTIPILNDYSKQSAVHQEDVRWSLSGSWNLLENLVFSTRVASDHLRLYDSIDGHAEPIASNSPVVNSWKEGYYMFRLTWSN